MSSKILDFNEYTNYINHPLAAKWLTARITNQQMDNICLDLCEGNAYHALVLKRILFWHGVTPDKENAPRKPRLRNWRKNNLWLVKQASDWWDECRVKIGAARNALAWLRQKGLIETFQGFSEFYEGENGASRKATFIRLMWEKFFELLEKYFALPEPVVEKQEDQDDQNEDDEKQEGSDDQTPSDDTLSSDSEDEKVLPNGITETPPDSISETLPNGITETPPDAHFPLYTDLTSQFGHPESSSGHDDADIVKIEKALEAIGIFGENRKIAAQNGWTLPEVEALIAAAQRNARLENPAGFIVAELRDPDRRAKYQVPAAPHSAGANTPYGGYNAYEDQEFLDYLKRRYVHREPAMTG